MSEMTAEEFIKQREKDTAMSPPPSPSSQSVAVPDRVTDMSARDFIMNRVDEVIFVPITGPDGVMDIEIRVMLNKREVETHKNFLVMLDHVAAVDASFLFKMAAPFLATITVDPELNEEFWLSDEIDPYLIQTLVAEFIKKNR